MGALGRSVGRSEAPPPHMTSLHRGEGRLKYTQYHNNIIVHEYITIYATAKLELNIVLLPELDIIIMYLVMEMYNS